MSGLFDGCLMPSYRWLKTPAFGLWLAQQEQIVKGVLEKSLESK